MTFNEFSDAVRQGAQDFDPNCSLEIALSLSMFGRDVGTPECRYAAIVWADVEELPTRFPAIVAAASLESLAPEDVAKEIRKEFSNAGVTPLVDFDVQALKSS